MKQNNKRNAKPDATPSLFQTALREVLIKDGVIDPNKPVAPIDLLNLAGDYCRGPRFGRTGL